MDKSKPFTAEKICKDCYYRKYEKDIFVGCHVNYERKVSQNKCPGYCKPQTFEMHSYPWINGVAWDCGRKG